MTKRTGSIRLCRTPAGTTTSSTAPKMRGIVRTLRREGVDLIKIMPSGGVLSIGDDPNLQLMADDEIKAVTDTAHSLGLKVAAHAHGKKAIEAAVRLGVDSIEHGSFADAGTYQLMKQHGTYLVPTLLVAQTVYDIAKTPRNSSIHHPRQRLCWSLRVFRKICTMLMSRACRSRSARTRASHRTAPMRRNSR
jgi:imidazolonepropionase-like amidohydrolase